MRNKRKAGTKESGIKKVLYPVSAVVLALGLGIGAILLSMLNVQASTEMMPGIEQILDEKSSETPFRILELVNDSKDAEIGYYISGQEPYLTQYKYTPTKEDGTKGDTQTFSSVEEGLSVLPTKEERQKFVEASDTSQIKNPLDFSGKADNSGTSSETSYPLSFKSYAEKYFLSKTDDANKWNRVDLKETRKETLTGHYEENASGKGDYTKEEQQYYPIREDVDSDGSTTQKYRENIKNFFYSDDTEASAPYQLSFEEVDNEDVNDALNDNNDTTIENDYDYSKGGFGYYENVYSEITSEIAENIEKKKYTFPGENPTVADATSGDDSDSASDGTDNSGTNGDDSGDTDNSDSSNDSNSDDSTDTQNEVEITDTDDLTGGEDDGTATQNDVTTSGTQANPKIYRGENISEHPYYKYTLVGDLDYVKEQADKNKDTTNHEDGDITLEDGQYWYWTEESTDNGDDSSTDTQSDGEETSAESSSSAQSEDDSSTGDSSTGDSDTADGASKQSGDGANSDNSDTTKGVSSQSANSSDIDNSVSTKSVSTQATTDGSTGSDKVMKKEALYIVTGRQAVSMNQVKEIPEDFTYNYYYKVRSIKYCSKLSTNGQETDPEAYTYYGWYYASHPSNEDTYLEASEDAKNASEETDVSDWNTKATHYISEAQYTLTPGKGGYDFVEGTSAEDTKQSVEIDHLFYQGGYTNHDWFKRYVFHLDPDSEDDTIQEQFKNLSIKVDTRVINTEGTTETAASELPKSDLDEYDLIYVNGKLSSTQASNIAATTKLPAIINQEKAMGTDEDKKVIEDAFAAYIDADYDSTSTPYVSERIYFINSDLCNQKFSTKFTDTELDAFSEITDYIKSENNYREVVESGENGEKTDRLSEVISQARVIEYIINYQYKRETAYKDTINILDIEPASTTASLTAKDVRKWLGQNETGEELLEEEKRGTIKNECCEETEKEGTNGPASKIVDNDEKSYWHSRWSSNKETGPHWFEYKLSSADSKRKLKGFRYVARPNGTAGYANGKPLTLTVEMYDSAGKQLKQEVVTLSKNVSELNSWTEKTYVFSKSIENVSYIKVIFTDCYNNEESTTKHSSAYATCAEFSTLYTDKGDDEEQVTEINITHMTSSEFVGHIDDINTKYDAIYFGDSYNNWNFLRNGDLDDENKKTSLYAHIGGVFGGEKDEALGNDAAQHRWFNTRLMGLLNNDYVTLSDGTKILWGPNSTAFPKEYVGKIGVMRGSGNDITKQQVKELNDFVSSGYPVIIGDALLNSDGSAVNTNVVDSSSYMYQFLNNAVSKQRTNVMSKSEADKKENLNFFFYLSKPEISFSEGGMPVEPVRLNNTKYTYNEEAGQGLISQNEDGLIYKFTIKNNSEVSAASATYNCELFIDLNFDGNLSSNEEQSEYIQIQDEKNNVVKKENGKYHLKIGKEYTLTRKIPKDYYKVITWKLQVSNNDNPSIRTSRMGFTKREAKEVEEKNRPTIRVLQIYPEQKRSDAPVTWNLEKDTSFRDMLDNVKEFNIEIEAIQTRTYERRFENYKEEHKDEPDKTMLDEYQMVIIGFADGFSEDNISNDNGEVDAIGKFIKEGKSVIFAHDTTSFINRVYPKKYSDTLLYDGENKWANAPTTWVWGYSLNTYLRASVGMDRYGITSDTAIDVDGRNTTVSKELKKGEDLQSDTNTTLFDAIKKNVSDMAYIFGTNQTKSSLMTQGFSNNVLYHVNGVQGTKNASKVNEGAITQYPYYVADKISTAYTHSQYYQLALEEDSDNDGANDIVVWYCLADGDSTYVQSPNDVRNNYYFYSKGNVIYTGVGHQSGNTNQERQLFANAVIAAANVSAVEPEATFLDDFDPVSEQEEYRYYMPDRLKATEVSGTSSNILDGDNTFNIRIRDYNMVASNLNYKDDDNSNSLTMELYIEDKNGDTTITVDGKEVQVSKISDPNKVGTLKKYSDGQTINVESEGKYKGMFKLPGNDTFQFTLNDMESYLKDKNSDGTLNGNYKKQCRIFAQIKSSVVLYGTKADKETWTSISLKPRQLFDLD